MSNQQNDSGVDEMSASQKGPGNGARNGASADAAAESVADTQGAAAPDGADDSATSAGVSESGRQSDAGQHSGSTKIDGETMSDVTQEEVLLPAAELAAALKLAQSDAEDYKDQYLRAKAEAENIRRRSDQARTSARKYAVEEFAREMLEVRDSLDHAGNVDLPEEETPALKLMKEGLELTARQMDNALTKFHVSAVSPEPGEKFDPEAHQATSMQPADDIPANHIVAAFRKGYRLHDRLLRPAMVVVASAPSGAKAGAKDDAPSTQENMNAGDTDASDGQSDSAGESGEAATNQGIDNS